MKQKFGFIIVLPILRKFLSWALAPLCATCKTWAAFTQRPISVTLKQTSCSFYSRFTSLLELALSQETHVLRQVVLETWSKQQQSHYEPQGIQWKNAL